MSKVFMYTSVYATGSSNCFLIQGENGVIAVDGGGLYGAEQVQKVFDRSGIDPKAVKLIIASHTHVDHTCNLEEFRKLTGAPIAVHANGKSDMENAVMPHVYPRNYIGDEIMEFAKKQGGMPDDFLPPIVPDITIEDDFDLTPYGVAGKVIHTPGHSLADVCVVLEDGTAVIGDLICEDMFTHGRPTIAYFGYNPDRKLTNQMLLPSIQKLLDAGATYFYAGHGGPFTLEQVKAAQAEAIEQDSKL